MAYSFSNYVSWRQVLIALLAGCLLTAPVSARALTQYKLVADNNMSSKTNIELPDGTVQTEERSSSGGKTMSFSNENSMGNSVEFGGEDGMSVSSSSGAATSDDATTDAADSDYAVVSETVLDYSDSDTK